jgi:hypothetical protein
MVTCIKWGNHKKRKFMYVKGNADGHADTVANGRERARVDNLAGEASVEPLRYPAAHREAIDHDGCIRNRLLHKAPAQLLRGVSACRHDAIFPCRPI